MICELYFKALSKTTNRTSLVVQWLRLVLPVQGAQVRSLVRELGSHMLCGAAKKKKKPNKLVMASHPPQGDMPNYYHHVIALTMCWVL